MKKYMIIALGLLASASAHAMEPVDLTEETIYNSTGVVRSGDVVRAHFMFQVDADCKPSITARKNTETDQYSFIVYDANITRLPGGLFRFQPTCNRGASELKDPALIKLFKRKLNSIQ